MNCVLAKCSQRKGGKWTPLKDGFPKEKRRDFPGAPVSKTVLPVQGAGV